MAGIIVDIVILAIILIPTIRGFHKGLTDILFGFLATIVAVIIAFIFYKPVAGVVIERTQLDEYFQTGIYEILNNQNFEETEFISHENTNMSEQLVDIINKFLAEALEKSADNVFGYVSIRLSHMMVNLITLIVILIVIRIILAFFKSLVDIIANLPILKQINKTGGMAIGFIKGFLIVYIILAIFSTISPMIEKSGVLGMIQESRVGSVLYNNNIILNFISKGI